MRELTFSELQQSSGGVDPISAGIAIVVAGATLYGAAEAIYNFGKAVGGLFVEPADTSAE